MTSINFSRRLVLRSLFICLSLHWLFILSFQLFHNSRLIRRHRQTTTTKHPFKIHPSQLPVYYNARRNRHDGSLLGASSIVRMFNATSSSSEHDQKANRLACVDLFIHRLLEKGHHTQFPLSTINHGPELNGIDEIRLLRSAMISSIHHNPIGMWEMPMFAYNESESGEPAKLRALDYQGDVNVPLTSRLMHWWAFSKLLKSIEQMLYEGQLAGFIHPLSTDLYCSIPRQFLLHLEDRPRIASDKQRSTLISSLEAYSHLTFLYSTYRAPDYSSLEQELKCLDSQLSADSPAEEWLRMMRYLRSVLFQVFIALDSARQSVGFVHGQLDFDHIYMEPTDQSWTKLSVVDEWPGSPAFPLSQQDLNRTALFENRLFTNQSNPIIFACPWMPPVNRNNTATAYWRFRRSDEFYYLPVRDSYQRIARILPSFDHSRIQLSKDSKIDRQHPLLAIFDYLPEKDLMHSNRFWHGFVIDSRTPQPEEILFSQRGSFRWHRERDGMPRTLRILDYREIGRQLERWWSGNFALKLPIDLPSNRSELAQIISSFESLISHLMGNRKQLDQQSPLDHPIFSQYRQSPAQSDIVINLTK